jgi:hypothetical protein
MCCCLSISDEGHEFLGERSEGDVDISNDVERQSIVSEDDGKER